MARPVTVNIPHQLGKDEARRRIAEGFANVERQLAGNLAGVVSFQERWEGDKMHFEGGAFGQKIKGGLEVLGDAVRLEVELPALLAAIADRIAGTLKRETQKLLEKK